MTIAHSPAEALADLNKLMDYADDADGALYGTLTTTLVRDLTAKANAALAHPNPPAPGADQSQVEALLSDERQRRIAEIVHCDCTLLPGATFYNAAVMAIRATLAQIAAHPQPSGWRDIAPKGWKLMPIEPTDDMVIAFAETWFSKVRAIDDPEMADAYRDMLAAAPAHPTEQQEGRDARDAARYRWLRNPTTDVGLVIDKVVGETPLDEQGFGGYKHYEYRAGDELDAAINAAMTKGVDACEGEGRG